MTPPYITAWSGETGYTIRPEPFAERMPALFCHAGKQGDGRPVWGRISEERQRRCAALRLCQICGRAVAGVGYALVITSATSIRDLVLTEPLVCRGCLPATLSVATASLTAGHPRRLLAFEVSHYDLTAVLLRSKKPETEADRAVNEALFEAGLDRVLGFLVLDNMRGRQLSMAELQQIDLHDEPEDE